MIDKLLWLFVLGYVIYYVYNNTFWFRDTEKIAENLASELAKLAEKYKDWTKSESNRKKEIADNAQKQFKDFVNTHEKYLHLIEKFKHDKQLKKQIRNDWESYLKATKTRLKCDMDYGMDLNEGMLKDTARKDHKAAIMIEEIEKRFNKYNTTT